MKVLLINSVCGRQSTGRIVSDIKKILKENGHDSRIAYGEKFSIAEPDDYHIGNEIIRYLHAGYARCFDSVGLGSYYATKKLVNWIREYDPDIIHLHNIHGYYINIRVMFEYLKESNKKVVWTFHDCWPFTGHCAYFDYVGCEKWKTKCEKCTQRSEYPSRLLIDRAKRNFELKKELFTSINSMTLVTPSKWLSGLLGESFLKNYPTKVIYNGIDTSTFYPRQEYPALLEKYKDKKIILGVSSVWDRRKGMNYFVELSKTLNDNYQIVLVGLTKKQINGLPGNIIGIERTESKEELARLYSSAFVFLNPTLEDNFPTTNIEALACGTPVITFNTGGSGEAISTNTGKIVYKKEVNEIVQLLSRMKLNREDCAKAGKLFDMRDKYSQYLALYEDLCK